MFEQLQSHGIKLALNSVDKLTEGIVLLHDCVAMWSL
jgi:hypothetical protein